MPIYKYTLIKYAKSYSTWIILIITAILIILACGVFPFKIFTPKTAITYSKTILILIPIVITFLAIFSSVFSSFKSANMFKDEIEDGTFLIIISKPISRSKIFIYKWLSLQTFLLMYSLFTSLIFAITLTTFDNGNNITNLKIFLGFSSLKNKFAQIFGYTFIILYIMSLIFSSIALLISTKLSVGSTIGISIALGIIVPLTPVIRIFTQKSENISIIKPDFFEGFLNKLKSYKSSLKNSKEDYLINILNEENANNLINKYQKNVNKLINDLNNDSQNIYNIGINTYKKNTYKNLWFLDINYQISKLSSFVYDQIIPDIFQKGISSNNIIRTNYYETVKKDIFSSKSSYDKSIEKFNDLIKKSWNKTKEVRADIVFLWSKLLFIHRNKMHSFLTELKNNSINNVIYHNINYAYHTFHISNPDIISTIGDLDESKSPEKLNNILDNMLNNSFYKRIENLSNVIRTSEKQMDNSNVKQIASLYFLMWFFDEMMHVASTSDHNFNPIFYSILLLGKYSLNPIESLHHNGIRNFIKENNLSDSINNFHNKNPKNWSSKISFDKKTGEDFIKVYGHWLMNNVGTPLPNFYWPYEKISNFIAQGISFNKVKKKEYASKYKILIIFVTISILLIPITYITIRKKDFK